MGGGYGSGMGGYGSGMGGSGYGSGSGMGGKDDYDYDADKMIMMMRLQKYCFKQSETPRLCALLTLTNPWEVEWADPALVWEVMVVMVPAMEVWEDQAMDLEAWEDQAMDLEAWEDQVQ